MINTKDKIIDYFRSGINDKKDFKIGIEHEKFLFDNNNNKRIDYLKIKEMFSALLEFGWNPILEKNNVMTIEPGIYLAGWGGVRIEDDVIIGEEGCEILNKTTKDMVVLN